MIFKGTPNQKVTITERGYKSLINPLPKSFRFDKNGHYETNDPRIIKRMEKRFEKATCHKCRHCEFETFDKAELMRHYKNHKENENVDKQ